MNLSNISRTALDALKAKHSAICMVGYPVVPECHAADKLYRDLLSDMNEAVQAWSSDSKINPPTQGRRSRRQTPLVNVGYAMRVSVMLNTILSFFRYHQDTNNSSKKTTIDKSLVPGIQLVLFGAGLDVTGIWSLLLGKNMQDGDQQLDVRVLEIDVSEICHLKKRILPNLTHFDPTLLSSYTLAEINLNDLPQLEEYLNSWIDNEIPILFVSELVLTYLDESSANQLLEICSTRVQRVTTSAVVAFELLGPSRSHTDQSRWSESIVQCYKKDYCQQFATKLDQGMTTSTRSHGCIPSPFHPLGSTPWTVHEKLLRCGFGYAHACSAGSAIQSWSRRNDPWSPLEPFDEHAALALHLRSYATVITFGERAPSWYRQVLCPWTCYGLSPISKFVHGMNSSSRGRIWLCAVDACDEDEVRALFQRTYSGLAETNVSIRRMVTSALKSDLSIDSSASRPSLSRISLHYRDQGGFFLVALAPAPESTAFNSAERRQILGAIGVRRLNSSEVTYRDISVSTTVITPVFEVHRLLVDESSRRLGIGKLLVDRSIELIDTDLPPVTLNYQLLAVTPGILGPANAFYTSLEFSLSQRETVGELMMNTYKRTMTRIEC